MSRAPRVVFAGGIYHVVSRGNLRAPIYFDDVDRARFVALLRSVCARAQWDCQIFCLLTNHFHLVVETAAPTLSRGMQILNGTYSRRFNERHERRGHLFENRFWSSVIQDDRQLVGTISYVALNPVRAGLCERAEQWPWTGGSVFGALSRCQTPGHGRRGQWADDPR